MSNLRSLTALALCFVAVSCSPQDFLTRRLAARIIESSDTFKAPQQFWLHTGVISNKEYLSPEFLVLQHRGWISSSPAPCPPAVAPGPCWEATLTPIGVEVFHELISARTAAATNFIGVPIANRQLIDITGISKAGNYADVEFRWKWVAMNDVGSAFHSSAVEYNSAVTFKRYDDGWRVLENATPRSASSLEGSLKNTVPPQ